MNKSCIIIFLLFLVCFCNCKIQYAQHFAFEDRTPTNINPASKYPDSTSSNVCSYTFYYYIGCTQGSTLPQLIPTTGVSIAILVENQTAAIYQIDYSTSVTPGSIYSLTSISITLSGCDNSGEVVVPQELKCFEYELEKLTFSASEILYSKYLKEYTILSITGLRYQIPLLGLDKPSMYYQLSTDTFLVVLNNCNYKDSYSTNDVITNSCDLVINFYNTQVNVTVSPGEYKDSKVNVISDIKTYPDFTRTNTYNQISLYYYSALTFKLKSDVYYPFKVITSTSTRFGQEVYYPLYGDSDGITYLYSFEKADPTVRESILYIQNGSTAVEAASFTFNQIDYARISNTFLSSTKQVSNLILFTSSLSSTKIDLASVYYSTDSTLLKGNTFNFPFGFKSGFLNNFQYEASFICSNIYKTITFGQLVKASSLTINRDGIVDSTPPTVSNVELEHIGYFRYLVRITASDPSGVASIRLNEETSQSGFSAVTVLKSGSLVDGGVFEFIATPLIAEQSIDKIFVVDVYGNSAVVQADSFYSIDSFIYPGVNKQDIGFLDLIKSITFDTYEMDVSNGPAYNSIQFNFTQPINHPLFMLIFNSVRTSLSYYDYLLPEPSINNTVYTFKFSLEKNFIPGPLDFVLSISTLMVFPSQLIYSIAKQQVMVKSSTPDVSGPIITNIVKIPSSGVANLNTDPLQSVGWSITIEDKFNGYSHGYVVAQGLVDGSIYNFTLNAQNVGDKLASFTLLLSNISCVDQTFQIIEVKLYDSNYIPSYYILNKNTKDILANPINPLLNYLGNQDVLKLQVSCTPTIPDTSGPELLSIIPSKTSVDVGSNDRSISFRVEVQDLVSGINVGQSPVVYINSLFFNYLECKTRLVSCSSNEMNCIYECKVELPFAFGYPNSLIYQVYGIWNKNGVFSGYSYDSIVNQLAISNGTIETKFSNNIPYIQYTNILNSNGGNLLIVGRAIGDSETLKIEYSNGTSTSVVPICTSNLYCNVQLGASRLPFTIQIQLKDNSLSNKYTITPVIVESSIVGGGSSSSESSASTSESSCPGQPVCGGSSNGICTSKGCVCISPWFGVECKQKIIIIPQPSFNNTDPNITIIVPNESNNNQIEFTSLTSIVSLREIDIYNEPINTHPFSLWYNNQINSTLNEYYSNFTNINNMGKTTQVKVSVQWFSNQTNIEFAGNQLTMNPSSIKYTIEIKDYPFKSNLNSLEIVMSALFQSNQDKSCSSKDFGDSNEYEDSNYLKLQVNDHSLYARFIKRGIIDDNRTVPISNRLLDSNFTTINQASTTQSYIGITIQHFDNIAIVDPDFSVMLDYSKSSNSICNNSSKLTSTQIAGIVIGCVGFAAVVAISVTVYFIKKRRNEREMSNLSNKLKSLS